MQEPQLQQLKAAIKRSARSVDSDYKRGLADALLAVVDAARERTRGATGLAQQAAVLESGSLTARMLLEIASGVQGANADLAERLDSAAWQVSRAGRRLRQSGLATRQRSGRFNGWALTALGRDEASRLRAKARRRLGSTYCDSVESSR